MVDVVVAGLQRNVQRHRAGPIRPRTVSRPSPNTTPRTIRVPVIADVPSAAARSSCSCFAPGTKVWTLTGRQPIEKIKIGDRVLAQDVESGELAYKPVLAVTIRQPGPWMKIGLGSESITATPSHPFWVAGQGWRMTKQLEVGNRVHTLSGGVPVETIEKLPTPIRRMPAAGLQPDRRRFRQLFRRRSRDSGPRQHAADAHGGDPARAGAAGARP